MTVYIVEFKAFCTYDLAVDAVFSSLEKAEVHVAALESMGTCVITPYEVL